jgi:hypothetical protein
MVTIQVRSANLTKPDETGSFLETQPCELNQSPANLIKRSPDSNLSRPVFKHILKRTDEAALA